MFLDTSGRMTPLVYIPGADSLFWENSCASGSAAVGMYFASGLSGVSCDDKEPEVIKIIQPAGTLSVESISYGRIKLNGRVKFAE